MLRIKNFVSSKVKARKDKKFNEKFNFDLKHGDHRITILEERKKRLKVRRLS